MKKLLVALTVILSVALILPSVSLAANEKEKIFTETYKKAFESKDQKTLEGMLYTKGAIPEALEFYTMMMTAEMGSKISSIELRDLTAEEKVKAVGVMPSPDGGKSKLPVTPTKKLVLKIEVSDGSGTSSSSSESYVAEVDGKYMIPVPVAVK